MHREIQIKQFPIVTTLDGLRHETSGLCEKTNSIYIVFYLLYTTMSKWSECAHASGVWRVCTRSGLVCAKKNSTLSVDISKSSSIAMSCTSKYV